MSTYDTIIQMIKDGNEDAKKLIKMAFDGEHYAKRQLNRVIDANEILAPWMSAALEDETVGEEIKQDIRDWFSSWDDPARRGDR